MSIQLRWRVSAVERCAIAQGIQAYRYSIPVAGPVRVYVQDGRALIFSDDGKRLARVDCFRWFRFLRRRGLRWAGVPVR